MKPENIDIEVLPAVLRNRGFLKAKLGPSNKDAAWIEVGYRFRVKKRKSSVILKINNFRFLIKFYTAPFSRRASEFKKALYLQRIPNSPLGA